MNPDLDNLLAWLEQHGNDPDVVAGAARVGRLLAQGGEQ